MLTVLAAEFARAMREDAQSTINFKQETLAHYTAIAGLNEAILAIQTFNGDIDIDEDGDGVFDDDDDEEADEGEEDDEAADGDGEDGDEFDEDDDAGRR